MNKIEKIIIELEDGLKISKKDNSVKFKQLITNAQKEDKCETKLSILESRIVKLEKGRDRRKGGF